MINNLTSVVALGSLLIVLFGVLQLKTWPEPQECSLTYMYQYPRYTRIPVPVDAEFGRFRLYAYGEGGRKRDEIPVGGFQMPALTGVPVLFVHGHAGSHEQMRSLASVALHKSRSARNRKSVLDYFGVDYDVSLNGVFGAQLQRQADYLMHAVHAIRALYGKRDVQVTIVGHSMGAKVAQAAVAYGNVSSVVPTIVMISAPVDRPIINVDFYMDAFYKRIDAYWSQHRSVQRIADNQTALCCAYSGESGDKVKQQQRLMDELAESDDGSKSLDRLLLITIGGGIRDGVVHAGLTGSRFSDVHVMSENVPRVWRSTDHPCSVWCLEQVLVVNRFLYELGSTPLANQTKISRLEVARRHLAPHRLEPKNPERLMVAVQPTDAELDWVQSSQRQFERRFTSLPVERVEMIPLRTEVASERLLDALLVHEVPNFERGVVFGCAALDVHRNGRYCSKATRLDGYDRELPSKEASDDRRWSIHVDLHALKRAHPEWTHLLIRVQPSRKRVALYVDVHGDREAAQVQLPKWYSFSWSEPLLMRELSGPEHFVPLHIAGLHESYKSMEVELLVEPGCGNYRVTAQLCVPWTSGFEQYHLFGSNRSRSMHISVPVDRPANYNTTLYPVVVKFYAELNHDRPATASEHQCRVQLRVRNSFARTMANIVQQYAHWLPAHLTTVLLLTLNHQITVTPARLPFKCDSPLRSLLRSSSFFIITASRLFVKVLEWSKMMPPVDPYEHSMVLSVLIHGSAIALVSLTMSAVMGVVRVSAAPTRLIIGAMGAMAKRLSLSDYRQSIVIRILMAPIFAVVMSMCGTFGMIVAVILGLGILMYKRYVFAQRCTEESKKREESEEPADTPDTSETPGDVPPVPRKLTAAEQEAEDAKLPPIDIKDIERLEDLSNDDLNRLIRQTMAENRKHNSQPQGATEEAKRMAEYDAMDVRKNDEHFLVTLLLLLAVQTGLNVPSAIVCILSPDYSNFYALAVDPSTIPAMVTIGSLMVLYHIHAPRQIKGYSSVGTLLYVMAVLCVLYAQDSVYRLNALLSATFVCLTAHQWMCPVLPLGIDTDASGKGGVGVEAMRKRMFSPTELDAMLDKIMEAERKEAEQQREADRLAAAAEGHEATAAIETNSADAEMNGTDDDEAELAETDDEKLAGQAQRNDTN